MPSSDWDNKDHDDANVKRRQFTRKNTCISASISDTESGHTFPCIIRDVNPEGCKVKSDHINRIGDRVNVFPQGFKSPVRGLIVWRRNGHAGIKFSWQKDKQKNIWIEIIQHLQKNTTQHHPRYYELWFNYVTKSNEDLNETMDAAIQQHGQIPNDVLDKIYDEHISPSHVATHVEEVNSKFMEEFNILDAALGDASEFTLDYEKSLTNATEQLSGVQNGDQVHAVVARLIKATRDMEEKSRVLEDKLSSSREQINVLNRSLDVVKTESMTDALTNIANRKCFDEFLEKSVQQALESQEPLTLIVGDIDHFKKFNDSYGHLVGDQVLKLVAQALSANVKKSDLSARYGGEEFAVVMPQTDLEEAAIVANRIREMIMARELTKISTKDSLGSITMSFGVAVYRSGEDVKSFFERSDAALYCAKRTGRNRVKLEDEIDAEDAKNVA